MIYKAIVCCVYRVLPCKCGALPDVASASKSGLEYPYGHLSRRHAAALIAGIEPRRHYELLRVQIAMREEHTAFIEAERARAGDRSGVATLRLYGRIIRGEIAAP